MWFSLCSCEINSIRITYTKLNDKFDYTIKPCVFWNQLSSMKNDFVELQE